MSEHLHLSRNKRRCGSQIGLQSRRVFTGVPAYTTTCSGILTYIFLTLGKVALSLFHDVFDKLELSQTFSELSPLLELKRGIFDQAGVCLEIERLLSGLDRLIVHHDC